MDFKSLLEKLSPETHAYKWESPSRAHCLPPPALSVLPRFLLKPHSTDKGLGCFSDPFRLQEISEFAVVFQGEGCS